MKRILLPLIFIALAVAACGSAASEVGTAAGDDPVGDSAAGETVDSTVAPDDDDTEPGLDPSDEPAIAEVETPDEIITDTDIVDPQVTAPREVVINPENPSELWVRFPGGDPNCTAASVTVLTETPEQINIELLVGITTDALARSCLADEFILRVEVPLNEAATGKAISWTQPSDSDEAPLVTPDLSTDDFLGLTEAEAAAIAEENAIVWRVTRIDDSSNGVTDDFNPGRLNFQIDDGIITSVSLG